MQRESCGCPVTRLHCCLWFTDISQTNIFSHPTCDTYLTCDHPRFQCPHLSPLEFSEKNHPPPPGRKERRRPPVWTTHDALICCCALNILSYSAWWGLTTDILLHCKCTLGVDWGRVVGGCIFCRWWNRSPPTLDTYVSWVTRSDITCQVFEKTHRHVSFTWPVNLNHLYLCLSLCNYPARCSSMVQWSVVLRLGGCGFEPWLGITTASLLGLSIQAWTLGGFTTHWFIDAVLLLTTAPSGDDGSNAGTLFLTLFHPLMRPNRSTLQPHFFQYPNYSKNVHKSLEEGKSLLTEQRNV